MTEDRVRALRLEACHFFGVRPEDLDALLAANVGRDSVWNWLHWACCEWRYGWMPDIADKAAALGIGSALDFGCGVGEAGLHLAAQLDIPVTYCDRPGPSREFLCWRIGGRLDWSTGAPYDPAAVLSSGDRWDLILLLEVLEHLADAPAVLARLLKKATRAVCISGALGRPETDPDPLHVYRDSLLPVLEVEGWGILHGGGMPWWFCQTNWAAENGVRLLQANGEEAVDEGPSHSMVQAERRA